MSVNITYRLGRQPVSEVLTDELMELSVAVFETADRLDGSWRLTHMPDLTCFEARDGDRLVGFKLGYAVTSLRYYSWLGGVHPAYRRKGIARALMDRQHDWLESRDYLHVETETMQSNQEMARLNMSAGFGAVGMKFTGDEPRIIYRKSLATSSPGG